MSNFIYNHLKSIAELEELLISPFYEQSENISYGIRSFNDRVEKRYYIDDSDSCCCKVVHSDKGIHFYYKKGTNNE